MKYATSQFHDGPRFRDITSISGRDRAGRGGCYGVCVGHALVVAGRSRTACRGGIGNHGVGTG
jgi:hypothetical protein